jgi:UPF0755 protein
VTLGQKRTAVLLIPTGANFQRVCDSLDAHGFLRDPESFQWVSHRKKYDERVRPGRYRIRNGMNNNELVNLLRAGLQEPVNLIFQNVRTPAELAGRLARQVEPDSLALARLMHDPSFLRKFGVTPPTVFSLFIPNTYQVLWNITAEELFQRMEKECRRFWNDERKQALVKSGLSKTGVITLASIIEKETAKDDEKPMIAAVYLNRLKKEWPLQADPTLIFAWNDYSIRRVLDKHKAINSPYNTYTHTGLPPGPICLPSIASIDAVLFPKKTQAMYFCAREDLSGYHNFAVTLAEHNRNAKRYREAFEKLGIRN